MHHVESAHAVRLLRQANVSPTTARLNEEEADWLREAVKLYANASKVADSGGDVGLDPQFREAILASSGAVEVRGDLANWRALRRALEHYVFAVKNVIAALGVARPTPYVRTVQPILRKVKAAEARAHAVARRRS